MLCGGLPLETKVGFRVGEGRESASGTVRPLPPLCSKSAALCYRQALR